MKRVLWILLSVLIGAVAVAYGVGMFIPRDHVARMTINLTAPPAQVWALISDFANTPKWRTDVTAVVMSPQPNGAVRFTESSSQGEIPFEVVSQEPPARQVVRVVDDDQPFGGTWTWELERVPTGTKLTLTEAGFVKNPIFRAIGTLFFSPTDTMDTYLRALAKALGDSALPRIIVVTG